MALSTYLTENRRLICESYVERTKAARSKNNLASMLDINVCEWLCQMEPLHKASEWLVENFGNYVNGNYVKVCTEENTPDTNMTYTCEVYCGKQDNKVTLSATVTALVGCGKVKVEAWHPCYVFCSGCDIDLSIKSENWVVVYATDDVKVNLVDGRQEQFATKKLKTL